MNKRIQQLARSAGFNPIQHGAHVVLDISTEENIQRFARLIVRECAQVTKQPGHLGRSDLDWGIVFNEHFGIKK